MGDSTSRIFAVLGLALAVWIVTYWLYEPSSRRRVILDDRPEQEYTAPATPQLPQPRSLPPADPPPPNIVTPDRSPGDGEPSVFDEPVPPLPPAPVPGPSEVLIPPEFDEYTIQRGDTLQSIAQRVYGSRARWVAIAQANPLLTPDRLKPGRTVIRLPRDPDNIQGRIVKITPTPPPNPRTEPASAQPAQANGWRTYTVQESDTLWGIAKRLYGRASLTNLIAEANTDVLPDPDRLKAGIVLKIPPAPPAD